MYRRPPSLRKNRGNGNTIIVGDSQTSLLPIFSGGGGTSVHWLSLICPGMWLFPAMPGGGYSQYDGLYGEALPEIPQKYSTNICTRGSTPRSNSLPVEKAFYICDWILFYDSAGFQQLKQIQSYKQGMWKEYHLSIGGTQNCEKWYVKFVEYPPPPAPPGLLCQYDAGPIS